MKIKPIATGRRIRRKTALQLAKAQLAGGVSWGEIVIGTSSHFVCQKCGGEYHLRCDAEPCAFCDDCKDDVLAILAEAVVLKTTKVNRRVSKEAR